MRFLGVDIGSRHIKLALVVDGTLVGYTGGESGFDPLARCRELMVDLPADRVMATGYGRHLLELAGDVRTVTEIKAFARGAAHHFPGCRTVLDIGGQDTKVISLDETGRVRKFEMNDRCAAGTGKFIEVMARTLGWSLDEFAARGAAAVDEVRLSSMCAVFAESEVVSLIARGVPREAIAAAVLRAVAERVASLAARLPLAEEIVFAGGCARNPALAALIEKSLGRRLLIRDHAEFTGAVGAAFLARDEALRAGEEHSQTSEGATA